MTSYTSSSEPLVYHEQLVARVPPQDLRIRSLCHGELIALHQQIQQLHVASASSLYACLLNYAAAQEEEALACPRAALRDHVGGTRP